jgi:pyrroloquinoline quinone (PQQ) biosynthesis protein C
MAALLATYDRLLALSPAAALAGFVAYESQSSGIAAEKAAGLRRDHGLDENAVSFWDHHATVDFRHGQWATAALDAIAEDDLARHVRRAADAWWAFLDERDALVAA